MNQDQRNLTTPVLVNRGMGAGLRDRTTKGILIEIPPETSHNLATNLQVVPSTNENRAGKQQASFCVTHIALGTEPRGHEFV